MANCPRSKASKGPDYRVFHERLHRTSDSEVIQQARVSAEVRSGSIAIDQGQDPPLLIDGHYDPHSLFYGIT